MLGGKSAADRFITTIDKIDPKERIINFSDGKLLKN